MKVIFHYNFIDFILHVNVNFLILRLIYINTVEESITNGAPPNQQLVMNPKPGATSMLSYEGGFSMDIEEVK